MSSHNFLKLDKGTYTFYNAVYSEDANFHLWTALGLTGEPGCPKNKLTFKCKKAVLSIKKIETNTWNEKEYLGMLKDNFGYVPKEQ